MTALASFSLQQAFFSTLKANEAMIGLVGTRIYDAVPARALYPYASYGPVSLRDRSDSSNSGHEHIVSIAAYSRQPGYREAYALADAITEAIDATTLNLSGHKLILLRFDNAEFVREADSLTTRALVTFRALTETI